MTIAGLGKLYSDGEVVVRQGEAGNCMFVIQKGAAEVVRESHDGEVRVAVLKKGDIFGEMAIFQHDVRSATVRAAGEARVLTVDKRTFLRRVQEDPALALNILQILCERIRQQNSEIIELRRKHDPVGEPDAAENPAPANEPWRRDSKMG